MKINKHVTISCDDDANAILVRPLKTKSETEQLHNIKLIHQYLNARGIRPTVHIMGNDCPQSVKNYALNELKIELLLVPPYIHRVNAAEKAIESYKNHLITCVATVYPDFRMYLWCRILTLLTTTLNMLRPSIVNPRLSAEEFLMGFSIVLKHPCRYRFAKA